MCETKNPCVGLLNQELKDQLQLPDEPTNIHVCWFENHHFLLRFSIKTPEEVELFLRNWAEKTNVVWRVSKTDPRGKAAGIKNLFWKKFHCQNANIKLSKKTKNVHKKHTNCPAQMSVTIKQVSSKSKFSDTHLPEYPTIVKVNINHNHGLLHQDYLKNRSIPEEVREKFLAMYRKGHTPMSALNLHKTDLRLLYSADYSTMISDRSVCPDVQWCYRLFSSFHKSKRKKNNSEDENSPSEDPLLELTEEVIIYTDEEPSLPKFSVDDSAPNSKDETHIQQSCLDLTLFSQRLIEKVKTTPELFLPAVTAFNNSWPTFNADSQWINALNAFHEHTTSANTIRRSRSKPKSKRVRKSYRTG